MLVPDIELSNLSDEEFLIYRAKELQTASSNASKSWLITAQVLYPNNFRVQFEVYLIEKRAQNVKEAAKCFADLIQAFPEESLHYKEIDDIMRAVQSSSSLFDDTDGDTGQASGPKGPAAAPQAPAAGEAAFLSELFYALPKGIQRSLVLAAAERCTDTMSHCSLLLLLTSHFPETTHMQAPNLVDTLLSAEKLNPSPLNPYRRKLVCSVLPVVVGGGGAGEAGTGGAGLTVSPQLLHHLLLLAIEYYTALLYSTVSASSANKSGGSSSDGGGGGSGAVAAASQTWRSVFSCVRQIGCRLGWPLAAHFTPEANREVVLQRVVAHMKAMQTSGQPETDDVIMELTYVIATLFLHALYEYTTNLTKVRHAITSKSTTDGRASQRKLQSNQDSDAESTYLPSDNTVGSTVGLTLVEAFTAPAGHSRSNSVCSDDLDVLSPPRPKRHRTSQDSDSLVPCISVGQGEGVSGGGLAQALSSSIKCWDLLHSHPRITSESSRLLERLPLGSRLRLFTTDMLLHDARLTEASHDLRAMLEQLRATAASSSSDAGEATGGPSSSSSKALPFTHLETCLKLASVNYALNNFSGGAEASLEAMQLFPAPSNTVPPPPTAALLAAPHSTPTTPVASLTITSGVERHLHLLPLSRAHCLQFVVTLLINALRTRIVRHKFLDDLSIGHLLVLVQLDWPAHENTFQELVSVLVKQGGLSYEQFPLYVTTPAMIEELVYLHTRDGGSLHLDIAPPPPHISKQQRTVSTRGADRGSKHDFKQAMRKQMLRCDESVSQNMITFLNNEGHSIHQNLM